MNKKVLLAAGLLAVSGTLAAQSVYPGQHAGKLKKETIAHVPVKSFLLSHAAQYRNYSGQSPKGSVNVWLSCAGRRAWDGGHVAFGTLFRSCPVQ